MPIFPLFTPMSGILQFGTHYPPTLGDYRGFEHIPDQHYSPFWAEMTEMCNILSPQP